MAVWQFVLDLVPASSAHVAGVTAARMRREQLDEIRLGFSNADAEVLFARLGTLLPEKKSWSASLRIWGDEKTDDIQVGFDGQVIEDIQFRLNVADLSLPLVGGICELARHFRLHPCHKGWGDPSAEPGSCRQNDHAIAGDAIRPRPATLFGRGNPFGPRRRVAAAFHPMSHIRRRKSGSQKQTGRIAPVADIRCLCFILGG
jgi:hypothetical protein